MEAPIRRKSGDAISLLWSPPLSTGCALSMKISKSCSQGLLGALEFVLSLSTMEKYWELLIQEATELQIYVQGIQRTYKRKKKKKAKLRTGSG